MSLQLPRPVLGSFVVPLALLSTLTLAGCGGVKPAEICNSPSNSETCTCGTPAGGTVACPAERPEALFAESAGEIQTFLLNTTGILGAPTGTASGPNAPIPAMAISPSAQFLYAADPQNSQIDGYSINVSGALAPSQGSPFAGANSNAVQLTVDSSGQFLLESDTSGGSLEMFSINSTTGALSAVSGSPFSSTGSFPGSAAFTPSGNFLYVVDGSGQAGFGGVSAYSVNANGSLTPVNGELTLNGGAIDIAMYFTGQLLYVSQNNGIASFTIDSSTGALSQISAGTLAAANNPVQLALDQSGPFLYVANGGDGTIGAYAINGTTGALSPVAGSPFPAVPPPSAGGIAEFSIALDPSGQFLYACESGAIVEFSIDQTSGALTSLGTDPDSVNTAASLAVVALP
jgi:6-phosphogluconolactonase